MSRGILHGVIEARRSDAAGRIGSYWVRCWSSSPDVVAGHEVAGLAVTHAHWRRCAGAGRCCPGRVAQSETRRQPQLAAKKERELTRRLDQLPWKRARLLTRR